MTHSWADEDIYENLSGRKYPLEHRELVKDMVEVSRTLKSMFFVNSQVSSEDAHVALAQELEEMCVSRLRIADLGKEVSDLKQED